MSGTPARTGSLFFAPVENPRSSNWKKTNPDWQGICMAGNEVVTRAPTRRATANYIKWKLGLETERPEPVIANDQQR